MTEQESIRDILSGIGDISFEGRSGGSKKTQETGCSPKRIGNVKSCRDGKSASDAILNK